jgi:hypothetical protein
MLGAAAAMYGVYRGVDYAATNMIEGQRDFLATRHLLRSVPGSGLGAQSILSAGMSPMHMANSPQLVSQFGAAIGGVGSHFGMTAGQTRNVFGSLAGSGMVDTSSIGRASSTFRQSLQELKAMADMVNADIEEAAQIYGSLNQLGISSRSGRLSALRGITASSAMSGMSVPTVMNIAGGTAATAQSMGLSGSLGFGVGMSSINTAAVMRNSGLVGADYLNRVGGYEGFANRLGNIRMGMLNSSGGMNMISRLYDTSGNLRGDSRVLRGERASASYSFNRDFDPYELSRMQEGFSDLSDALILARVENIRSNASSSTQANRQQYDFLASMGISDPQEQLTYLTSIRMAPQAELFAGAQASQNMLATAQGGTHRDMISGMEEFRRAFQNMTGNIAAEFRRAGAALQMAGEDYTRTVLSQEYGRARSYSTGDFSRAALSDARQRFLTGDAHMGSYALGNDLRAALNFSASSGMLYSTPNMMGSAFYSDRGGAATDFVGTALIRGPRAATDFFGRAASSLLYGTSMARPDRTGSLASDNPDLDFTGPNAGEAYLVAAARDLGQAYDPTSGGLVTPTDTDYFQFAEAFGGRIDLAASGQISDIGRHIRDQQRRNALRDAGASVYFGGLVGGSAYFHSRMARPVLNAIRSYSDSQGVAANPALSASGVTALNRDSDLRRQTLNSIAQSALGQSYDSMGEGQRQMLQRYLAEDTQFGQLGEILTEGRSFENMSDMEFYAAVAGTHTQGLFAGAMRQTPEWTMVDDAGNRTTVRMGGGAYGMYAADHLRDMSDAGALSTREIATVTGSMARVARIHQGGGGVSTRTAVDAAIAEAAAEGNYDQVERLAFQRTAMDDVFGTVSRGRARDHVSRVLTAAGVSEDKVGDAISAVGTTSLTAPMLMDEVRMGVSNSAADQEVLAAAAAEGAAITANASFAAAANRTSVSRLRRSQDRAASEFAAILQRSGDVGIGIMSRANDSVDRGMRIGQAISEALGDLSASSLYTEGMSDAQRANVDRLYNLFSLGEEDAAMGSAQLAAQYMFGSGGEFDRAGMARAVTDGLAHAGVAQQVAGVFDSSTSVSTAANFLRSYLGDAGAGFMQEFGASSYEEMVNILRSEPMQGAGGGAMGFAATLLAAGPEVERTEMEVAEEQVEVLERMELHLRTLSKAVGGEGEGTYLRVRGKED